MLSTCTRASGFSSFVCSFVHSYVLNVLLSPQTKTLYFCLLVHLDVQLKILELKPNVKCPSPLLYSIYTFIFIFCPPPLYNASPLLCIRVDVLAFIQLSNLFSNYATILLMFMLDRKVMHY